MQLVPLILSRLIFNRIRKLRSTFNPQSQWCQYTNCSHMDNVCSNCAGQVKITCINIHTFISISAYSIISWFVECSKSVEVTKAKSLPSYKLTITQTYCSIHHGLLLMPLQQYCKMPQLGKMNAKNVMSRQKGLLMTFNFINSRFCYDAIEGFGQSSTLQQYFARYHTKHVGNLGKSQIQLILKYISSWSCLLSCIEDLLSVYCVMCL